jgi:hypothetical protein
LLFSLFLFLAIATAEFTATAIQTAATATDGAPTIQYTNAHACNDEKDDDETKHYS